MQRLRVGDIIKLKVSMFGNKKDDVGVVFEEYDIIRKGGVSVIFRNGEYDGFSVDEQEEYLEKIGHNTSIEKYKFNSVIRLSKDFERGMFDTCFN